MAINSEWKDRWVCIGGGTAGLGFVLAQQFARRGANVAIVGRNKLRAEAAADELRELGTGQILSFSVDLTDEHAIKTSQWKAWVEKTDLSVAIAGTGKSDRGFLTQLSAGDLDDILKVNLYTAFHFSKATQNALQRGAGTLVHIASLAGIVAKPGMGGYCVAKHAVVALSRQLRLELASQGVYVLLVCPGPIQRDEAHMGGRYDDLVNERKLPESLKMPAGGANLKAIDSTEFSAKIIRAIESRRKELVLPSKVRWLAGLGAIWPSLLDSVLKMRTPP